MLTREKVQQEHVLVMAGGPPSDSKLRYAADTLFRDPKHPYTVGLMSSFPPLVGSLERIAGIPGSPPNLAQPPPGCRFNPRCPHCDGHDGALFIRQTTERPRLREVAPDHLVACHLEDL